MMEINEMPDGAMNLGQESPILLNMTAFIRKNKRPVSGKRNTRRQKMHNFIIFIKKQHVTFS